MNGLKLDILGSFALGALIGSLGMRYLVSSSEPQTGLIEDDKPTQVKKLHRRRASNITSPPIVRAICFDLDGTLIKTEHLWFQLLKDATVYFNSPQFVTFAQYTQYFGQSMQQNVEQFLPDVTVEQLDSYCAKHYHEYIHLIDIVPGAVEALKFASEVCGENIFLTTNCPRNILNLILNAPQFSFIKEAFGDRIYAAGDKVMLPVQGSNGNGNGNGNDGNGDDNQQQQQQQEVTISPKPSTHMIDIVSQLTGVPTTHIMLVGDSIYDMQCIHAAKGIGVALHYPHINIDMDITDVKIDSLVEFYELQKLYRFENPSFLLPPL